MWISPGLAKTAKPGAPKRDSLAEPPLSKSERWATRRLSIVAFLAKTDSRYAASRTDKIFPAGSLNHAIVGPFPREMPRASVFKLGSL